MHAPGYVSVCILGWIHPQQLLELTDLGIDSLYHDTCLLLLFLLFFFHTGGLNLQRDVIHM